MTSALMKAAVDTILDEVTAASGTFVTTTEVYAALADGQNEVIKELLNVYRAKRRIDPEANLPYELESVLAYAGAGISASKISLPASFLEIISAKWDYNGSGTTKPCFVMDVTPGFDFQQNNTFLAASSGSPMAYVGADDGSNEIHFRPAYDTSANYELRYIKEPTAIASGQEPTLPVTAHSAIVNYAVARLFQKDDRPQDAQKHYNLYLQEIKTLLGV